MRVTVIINPTSGTRGRHPEVARRRAQLAKDLFSSIGVKHEVLITERAGHAYELARQAVDRHISLVYAWGGDGTMNEVGRALAFGPAALALIPAGSGNGLARELRVPFDPEQALVGALRSTERAIDVGEIGGRLFFNAAGVGFDAHVAAKSNDRPHGRRGLRSYITIATRELFTYRAEEYIITISEEILWRRALLVALANSRQYGNGAVVAPRAVLDDGLLDLVIVSARHPAATLWEARRLFNGTVGQGAGVITRRITYATITGTRPLSLHVDGEPVPNSEVPLSVRLHPAALRVRTGNTNVT